MVPILAWGLDLGEHPCERRPKSIRLLGMRECLSQGRAGYMHHGCFPSSGRVQNAGRLARTAWGGVHLSLAMTQRSNPPESLIRVGLWNAGTCENDRAGFSLSAGSISPEIGPAAIRSTDEAS